MSLPAEPEGSRELGGGDFERDADRRRFRELPVDDSFGEAPEPSG